MNNMEGPGTTLVAADMREKAASFSDEITKAYWRGPPTTTTKPASRIQTFD